MKNFGYSMEKNINPDYKKGKKLLETYIKKQEAECKFLAETIDKYQNSVFEIPDIAGVDINQAIVFLRTWKLINELPTDKKNLLLVFCACRYDYKKTLEVFNGVGKGCKNVATLRVLITAIRKIIRKNYNEQYGDNRFNFNIDDSCIYC